MADQEFLKHDKIVAPTPRSTRPSTADPRDVKMLRVLAEACAELASTDDDFWLLAALSDFSYEEGTRNRRKSKSFLHYVESVEAVGVDSKLLERLHGGINAALGNILQKRPDVRQASRRTNGFPDVQFDDPTAHHADVQVKLVHDGTGRQYYDKVSADKATLARGSGARLQVVFFTQLPCFHYPPGCWYGEATSSPKRRCHEPGIARQSALVVAKLGAPPTWPAGEVFTHRLAFPTAHVDEALLLARYQQVFKPDVPWPFVAAEQLKDAAVGVAIWQW